MQRLSELEAHWSSPAPTAGLWGGGEGRSALERWVLLERTGREASEVGGGGWDTVVMEWEARLL